jgi:ADP-ribose pyrophosphatase YjhB (NUDIX family)
LRARGALAFQGKFAVTAVAVVIDERGRVLLIEHRFRAKERAWALPGGFVEHPEQPGDAVRRELREEIGLEVEALQLVHVRTISWARHIEVLFRCRPVGEPGSFGFEVADAQWFGPSGRSKS